MKVSFACTLSSRLRGLYGRKAHEGILLLSPCHDIHTFFLKGPIDVAFINVAGIVLESWRNVGPWRRLRNGEAIAVLERYASTDVWYERGDFVQLNYAEEVCPQ